MSRLTTLLAGFRCHPSRVAIEGLNLSCLYSDLLDEIDRWSRRLENLPITAGSVIGLRTDYSLPAIAALLAILEHKLIPALIPRDRPVAEYLGYSHASALLDVDPPYKYEPLAPLERQHPLLEQLRNEEGCGFIVFTSGSTGPPKATLHSLDRFLLKFEKPGRTLRTLAFLLFDHIAGLDTLFYTLRNVGTLILTQRRDPNSILQLVSLLRIEVIPTSPSFLRLLCSASQTSSFDLSSLKVITYGSEPMDTATLQRISEGFPKVQVLQKYGTTEFGSPQTVSRSNDSLWLKFRPGGPDVKVVDNVLWVRSKGTMLGYINAPSPECDDGWLCTGDLVEVDGEWVRFTGRADDVFKVGGEKVSPSEVERIIRDLEFVEDVFVSSEPHSLLGRIVAARISVATERPDHSALAAAIRRYCRSCLGPHHAPVRISFVPRGSLRQPGYRMKVQRSQIAEIAHICTDAPAAIESSSLYRSGEHGAAPSR